MSKKSSLLCQLVSEGDGAPFIIFPAAGTTPLSLVNLARTIRSKRPVYSFSYAGMMDGQPAHTSVEEMALSYVEEIRDIQKKGPYFLGGHCFGGAVAHGVGARLEAYGEKVALVVLLESIPPLDEAFYEKQDSNDTRDDSTQRLNEVNEALLLIYEQTCRQLQRLPTELAEQVGEIYWTHTRAGGLYRANPIDSNIALLRTQTHSSELFQPWKELGKQDFTEYLLSGDTYSILRPPGVAITAAMLDEVFSIYENR